MKPEPIIRTKLHRPPVARDHLHRDHLLGKLNQHSRRPLTLVSAPAGYGKSTLMCCWLETCDAPGAWVSLDENDNDLRLFLSYFIAAIQNIFPNACAKTLSLLRVDQLPPVSRLAGSLINELDLIEKRFILVLDDYHLIQDKKIHKTVAKLLEHPAACMHLVLIGRRDPPLPLTALRASGEMTEMRTRNLRFSLDETRVFLQQMTGMSVDRSVAAILEEKTEGWVTGLRLAALSMRHNKDVERNLAELPTENRYVMDYVVTEILSHHPPAIQECMMKASVLGRFCASLCEAVCCPDTEADECSLNLREFLELLEKNNLFVIPLDDEGKWYRYHHLFQALLKLQLKQRFNTEEITKLHQQASAWFAQHGYIEEALTHAHKSGNLEIAAQLVKENRCDMMNREQWYQLNRWLQRFPPDFIQQNPDLLLAKAWGLQRQARYAELFEIVNKLDHNVSALNKESIADKVVLGEVQALKSFQYFATAQGKLSEFSARAALDNLPVQYHNVRGFSLVILSAALQMQGDPMQGKQVVMEALQQNEASITVFKTMLLAALCFTNWIAGDLSSLKQTAIQFLKHGQQHDLPETVALGHFFIGILHYQRNNLDLAERFLVPVVGISDTDKLVVPSVVTYCQSSFACSLTYQAMGRAKEASQVIESLIGDLLETGNAELLEICEAFRADLALHQGRVAEAELWAHKHAPKPLVPAYRFYCPHLTLPKVLLARRTATSLNEAGRLLSQMFDYYASIHSSNVLVDVSILQAMVHVAKGDELYAIEKLAEALALAEPGGFMRNFLDQGLEMADLLGRLIEQNPKSSFARQILEVFSSSKPASPGVQAHNRHRPLLSVPDSSLMEALSNREIEVLKKLADGLSNKQIADSLFISPETVKKHLYTIYGKLNVKNRHQAVISAKSIGIL